MATISKRTGIIAGGAAAVAAASIATFMLLSSTIHVAPGEDLQAALNSAPCGSTIQLDAGANYNANLTLPKKDCADYTIIQSSRASELSEGVGVGPAQIALLAKIQGSVPAEPVVKTALGANHYKFIGVEISTVNESNVVYDLVRLGDGREAQKALADVAHDLIIDRSWVHGFDTQEVQRGVSLQCASCDVTNSSITNIHMTGIEAQGIAGWNGPGPFRVINNYIEASTQGILFGGADPAISTLSPANIEIRRNWVYKPLTWKVGDPSYAGKHWTVKNILELKNAKNVVIDGNVFENNWTDGQDGKAILFTVRNQECSAPESTIQNVTFTNNTVKNAEGGLNFLGKDNEAEPSYQDRPGHVKCSDPGEVFGSVRASGFSGSNNLFYDIRGSFITINGFYNVSLNRTTHLQVGNLTTIYGEPSQGFQYTNNLTTDHEYGFWTEAGIGVRGLNKLVPGAVIQANVIAAPYDKGSYPTGNLYPDSITLPPDFHSPFPNAGADIDALLAAQAGNGPSQPSPTATASVTVSPSVSPSPSATAPNGIPSGSSIGIVSPANVREGPSQSSKELFIAQVTDQGSTTGSCQQDTSSANVYCPVTFSTRPGSGFVAMQFLRVVSASPSPIATPTSTPTPATPTPTATPVPPTPTPTSTPTPRPTPLPFCASGQRPGSPPTCRCRNGMLGNSGKCR